MSEMLCYVDQKPTLSSPGGYKPPHHHQAADPTSISSKEYQTGYSTASDQIQHLPPVGYNPGFAIPNAPSSPNSVNQIPELNQGTMSYAMPYQPHDYPQPAVNGRIQSVDGQQFGSWTQPFNTFGSIPPSLHMDRVAFDWERQYSQMQHAHPAFPMQHPHFPIANTTPSPNSVLDERSPDMTGMPYGGQAFFGTSPPMVHNHHEIDETGHAVSPAPNRRPYEWINKNSYQSLPPPRKYINQAE